jgi:transcriptional regulator with XRE-family HTH domain
MSTTAVEVGDLLREWRQRRRKSQLELAIEADVSSRHISFLETGRARPSRDMVLRLADHLDVPLRDRNRLLLAAGFAPVYGERPVDAPEMTRVRETLDKILKGHEPYPALVVDRQWNLVAANAAIEPFVDGVAPALLEPPANVIRLCLHPDGVAPRVANLPEVRAHLLHRLVRQADLTGDPQIIALIEELRRYPAGGRASAQPAEDEIAVPMKIRTKAGLLQFFSTVATFGTAVDITLAELSVEVFWPADDATARALHAAP